MRPHVHTGFIAFVFAGASAVVFLNLMRFAAAQLVERPGTEAAGKALGALVTFGGK